MKLKNGNIPYGLKYETPDGVYSIDRFTWTFRVPIEWWNRLSYTFDHCRDAGHVMTEDFVTKRYGREVRIVQDCGFHLEMWRSDKPGEPYSIRLDYNPNKSSETWIGMNIFDAIRRIPNQSYVFDLQRVDYAYDIPVPLDMVYVLSRKQEGSFAGTRYYGVAGSNGRLRVYDKRKELKDKDGIDVGCEVTRVEWEQRSTKDFDFRFDQICVANFKDMPFPASVIPCIDPANINTAFRRVDWKTRQKYKALLKPYPFEPLNFALLFADYMDLYHLSEHRWDYVHHCTKASLKERMLLEGELID